jgi:hypothetical protein
LASAGAAFTTGKIDTDVTWKTLAVRIHARPLGGLYLSPASAATGTMTRDVTPPCTTGASSVPLYPRVVAPRPNQTDTSPPSPTDWCCPGGLRPAPPGRRVLTPQLRAMSAGGRQRLLRRAAEGIRCTDPRGAEQPGGAAA